VNGLPQPILPVSLTFSDSSMLTAHDAVLCAGGKFSGPVREQIRLSLFRIQDPRWSIRRFR
jgi:hypothetical protein